MYFTESERDSDRQILQFVENLERHGLGCDGFHLSSGYTTQQGKRCVFCWNNDRFPDPEAFLHRMEELGVPMSPNIKPALLTEHPLYGEFRNGNAFFTDPAWNAIGEAGPLWWISPAKAAAPCGKNTSPARCW